MRKFLLASTTMLGTSVGTLCMAFAQTPAPAQKQIIQVETGATGANSNNNYQPAPIPGPVAAPAPGTMVFRLNGSITTGFGVGGR